MSGRVRPWCPRGTMEFRILGRLEVHGRSGELVSLGRHRQRVLLGMLLMHANRPLSTQVIVDQLWPQERPPSAAANVQTYVAGLRRALRAEPERLLTTKYGYQIRVESTELDATAWRRWGGDDEEGEVFAGLRVDGHGQADAAGIDHASHGGSTQAEPGRE